MKVRIFCVLIIFFWLSKVLNSQSLTAIGQWKSHLSYKEGKKITQSSDKVIYASIRGIFTIDKEDNSVEFLSKENGLTEINVQEIYYDKNNEQLIIIYLDNSIDIYTKSEVISIPFIKTNNNILGSKTINDFFIENASKGYFATDFGVLGFDLNKLEFLFTTFTDLKVFSVAVHSGVIYAGTEEGLYRISTTGNNLSDFNTWENIGVESGLPPSFEVKSLAVKFNQLFALIDNKVYKMEENGQFTVLFSSNNSAEKINFISDEGSELMIGIESNNNTRVLFVNDSGNFSERGIGCINKGVYAVEDEKGRIWYADQWDPVKYTENKISGDCKKLSFQVPYNNEASNVRFKKNKAYFGSGGVTEDFQYRFTRYGFYTLEDNIWKNYNDETLPILKEKDFFHLYTLVPHPKTSELYLGSYYNGLISYNEDTKETSHWNKDNSILQAVVGDDARTRIAGLTFDKEENLWISNFGAPKPLVVKTNDNSWYNFSVPGSTNLADIVIDNQGNKWITVVGVGNGIIVYNEGNKIDDPADDKIRYITKNNSEISGNKVNSIMVDLDGSVWVGTDQGPIIFDCGDPFNDACRGTTRKVVVDGIPALLLKDEDILCIESDGGNRKWFGTRNGVFVQSPDGSVQESKFDIKNSPLLDNKVTDLAFNPISGEMFIISSGGIQSYRTESTGGGRSHSSSVYAYPNPVRPDYTGLIAIKGLVRDANVKITDVNGRLIYETKALGGQAVWDGMDYNGKKAATGVYLVFSANENTSFSSDAYVTKILIVN